MTERNARAEEWAWGTRGSLRQSEGGGFRNGARAEGQTSRAYAKTKEQTTSHLPFVPAHKVAVPTWSTYMRWAGVTGKTGLTGQLGPRAGPASCAPGSAGSPGGSLYPPFGDGC